MEKNELDYLEALELENKRLNTKNTDYQSAISNTSFNSNEGNLAQWQVESDDILDKIEHFLKGDVVKVDTDGNVFYEKQKDQDLIILNVYGVNSIMQILGNYINKNIILSYYDEERIYEILGDLGDELSLFLYCNYEKMGMTTEFKKSRYILLVLNLLHIVESSYRRALHGTTMEQINTNTNIIQSEQLGINRGPISMPKKKFNLFRMGTW